MTIGIDEVHRQIETLRYEIEQLRLLLGSLEVQLKQAEDVRDHLETESKDPPGPTESP